jgi:hypothetical protein
LQKRRPIRGPFAQGQLLIGGPDFVLPGQFHPPLDGMGRGFGPVGVEHHIAGGFQQISDIERVRADNDLAEGHAQRNVAGVQHVQR